MTDPKEKFLRSRPPTVPLTHRPSTEPTVSSMRGGSSSSPLQQLPQSPQPNHHSSSFVRTTSATAAIPGSAPTAQDADMRRIMFQLSRMFQKMLDRQDLLSGGASRKNNNNNNNNEGSTRRLPPNVPNYAPFPMVPASSSSRSAANRTEPTSAANQQTMLLSPNNVEDELGPLPLKVAISPPPPLGVRAQSQQEDNNKAAGSGNIVIHIPGASPRVPSGQPVRSDNADGSLNQKPSILSRDQANGSARRLAPQPGERASVGVLSAGSVSPANISMQNISVGGDAGNGGAVPIATGGAMTLRVPPSANPAVLSSNASAAAPAAVGGVPSSKKSQQIGRSAQQQQKGVTASSSTSPPLTALQQRSSKGGGSGAAAAVVGERTPPPIQTFVPVALSGNQSNTTAATGGGRSTNETSAAAGGGRGDIDRPLNGSTTMPHAEASASVNLHDEAERANAFQQASRQAQALHSPLPTATTTTSPPQAVLRQIVMDPTLLPQSAVVHPHYLSSPPRMTLSRVDSLVQRALSSNGPSPPQPPLQRAVSVENLLTATGLTVITPSVQNSIPSQTLLPNFSGARAPVALSKVFASGADAVQFLTANGMLESQVVVSPQPGASVNIPGLVTPQQQQQIEKWKQRVSAIEGPVQLGSKESLFQVRKDIEQLQRTLPAENRQLRQAIRKKQDDIQSMMKTLTDPEQQQQVAEVQEQIQDAEYELRVAMENHETVSQLVETSSKAVVQMLQQSGASVPELSESGTLRDTRQLLQQYTSALQSAATPEEKRTAALQAFLVKLHINQQARAECIAQATEKMKAKRDDRRNTLVASAAAVLATDGVDLYNVKSGRRSTAPNHELQTEDTVVTIGASTADGDSVVYSSAEDADDFYEDDDEDEEYGAVDEDNNLNEGVPVEEEVNRPSERKDSTAAGGGAAPRQQDAFAAAPITSSVTSLPLPPPPPLLNAAMLTPAPSQPHQHHGNPLSDDDSKSISAPMPAAISATLRRESLPTPTRSSSIVSPRGGGKTPTAAATTPKMPSPPPSRSNATAATPRAVGRLNNAHSSSGNLDVAAESSAASRTTANRSPALNFSRKGPALKLPTGPTHSSSSALTTQNSMQTPTASSSKSSFTPPRRNPPNNVAHLNVHQVRANDDSNADPSSSKISPPVGKRPAAANEKAKTKSGVVTPSNTTTPRARTGAAPAVVEPSYTSQDRIADIDTMKEVTALLSDVMERCREEANEDLKLGLEQAKEQQERLKNRPVEEVLRDTLAGRVLTPIEHVRPADYDRIDSVLREAQETVVQIRELQTKVLKTVQQREDLFGRAKFPLVAELRELEERAMKNTANLHQAHLNRKNMVKSYWNWRQRQELGDPRAARTFQEEVDRGPPFRSIGVQNVIQSDYLTHQVRWLRQLLQREDIFRRHVHSIEMLVADLNEMNVLVEQCLQCPLCQNMFHDPVILWPCGHTYCSPCCDSLRVAPALFQCAVCRSYGSEASINNILIGEIVAKWVVKESGYADVRESLTEVKQSMAMFQRDKLEHKLHALEYRMAKEKDRLQDCIRKPSNVSLLGG